MKRSYSSIVYFSEPGLARAPEAGQVRRQPAAAREELQPFVASCSGTPCRYSAAASLSASGGCGAAPEDRQPVELARCGRSPRAPGEDIAARRWRIRCSHAAERHRRARLEAAARARVRRIRERLREVYGVPLMRPHRDPDRRADPDGALAVDQRPQPRRRLPAPARALRELGAGARRAAGRGRGGDPPGRHLEGQVGAHPGDPAGDLRGDPGDPERRAVARLARRGADRAGARLPRVAARGGAQDGRLRAAVRLRPARRAGRHPRLARGHAPAACCARARRSRSCTTRCSRSPRPARSSSCTSTCCATAGAPATRARPPAGVRARADVPEPRQFA